MFANILQRMIFWELVKVFTLAFTAITGLLLLGGIFQEASQRGLEPAQILAVIPLLIPSTLPYTLPATTLFATCVVYGRLAHDNEILAVRSAGVNVLRMLWPAIILGALMSALTGVLYFETIPVTQRLVREVIIRDVEEYMYTVLRRDGKLMLPQLHFDIFVQRVEGRKLIEAQFMRRDPKTKTFDFIARAREAELQVNVAKQELAVVARDCDVVRKNDDNGFQEKFEWTVELPKIDSIEKQRADHLAWTELWERRDQLGKHIEYIEAEITAHQIMQNLGKAPDHYGKHVQDLRNQVRFLESQVRHIDVEAQKRPALALGCLCFVLVGCPVGIWFGRSDYLSAFITCFLPIVVLYYPLLLCGINVAKTDNTEIPLALAIWAADGLMGCCAIGLFRRLLRN